MQIFKYHRILSLKAFYQNNESVAHGLKESFIANKIWNDHTDNPVLWVIMCCGLAEVTAVSEGHDASYSSAMSKQCRDLLEEGEVFL
jgi:hypothetical protein